MAATRQMHGLVNTDRIGKPARRGQAAVEAALAIIPLMALLCAIIDFSMAIFIRNSLILAVRDGTRYAVTGQTGAGGNACQDASIKYIVQQEAMGFLSGAAGLAHIQLNYFNPTTLANVTALPNANAGGNIVQVSVTGMSWLWMLSGVWENASAVQQGTGTPYSGLTIGAASSDVMEAPPNNLVPCR